MLTLEEAIKAEEAEILAYEKCLNSLDDNMPTDMRNELNKSLGKQMDYHRQLAEWLRELKAYREDTRFADLYERICIKRDDDRDYFARTKDKTYLTRIAEKEVFIHMMQDMMFDRYGVEEVNADADSD